MRAFSFLPLLWIFLTWVGPLRAHQVDSVEMEFQAVEGEWWLTALMDIAFVLPETRGEPDAPPLYRADVMQASPDELARMRGEVEKVLRRILVLTFNDQAFPWTIQFPDFDHEPLKLPEEEGGWAFFTTRVVMKAMPGPGELKVTWKDDEETELIVWIANDAEPTVISTSPGMSSVLWRVGQSGDDASPGQSEHATGWLVSGFRHVIPLGLDHLLFILGLFLLAPRWKPLLVQSLLFTLAHSVTLALAVFQVVRVPDKPVEILIAASIAWIGIENLLIKELKARRLVLAFGFGLIHGLGFASVLGEKLEEIPPNQLALPLIGFNLGVELAQVTVLVLAFALLWPLKKWQRQVQIVGSVVVALAGLGWLFERLLS